MSLSEEESWWEFWESVLQVFATSCLIAATKSFSGPSQSANCNIIMLSTKTGKWMQLEKKSNEYFLKSARRILVPKSTMYCLFLCKFGFGATDWPLIVSCHWQATGVMWGFHWKAPVAQLLLNGSSSFPPPANCLLIVLSATPLCLLPCAHCPLIVLRNSIWSSQCDKSAIAVVHLRGNALLLDTGLADCPLFLNTAHFECTPNNTVNCNVMYTFCAHCIILFLQCCSVKNWQLCCHFVSMHCTWDYHLSIAIAAGGGK